MSVPLSIDPVALQAEKKAYITAVPNATDGMGIKAINDPHNKRMELTTPEQAAEDAAIRVAGLSQRHRRQFFGRPHFPGSHRRKSSQIRRSSETNVSFQEPAPTPKAPANSKRSLTQRLKGVLHLSGQKGGD